jgi:hypothetical protein
MTTKNTTPDNKESKSFLMSINSLFFTDDETDLVSNDFHLDKDQIVKKKTKQLKKPQENIMSDSVAKQKQIIQKNTIIKERLLTVDKILELYPNLKKDKKSIINNILGTHEVQKKIYIIEKINIKNKSIYKDTFGNLMDENVNLVGFWSENTNPDQKTDIIYYFFDDIKKIKIKLSRNKKKIDMAYIDNMKNNMKNKK